MEARMSDLFAVDEVRREALIEGEYRYWLTREWEPGKIKMAFIMLNPSTADAEVDDPTIRRCMGFARRDRWGGIVVMNLFAFRATSPADMKRKGAGAVGPKNDWWLKSLAEARAGGNGPVVCAWGAHGSHLGQDKAVLAILRDAGVTPLQLGLTASGAPRHPLYLRSDAPLQPMPNTGGEHDQQGAETTHRT
jgi:hypothetical protein